MFIVTDKQFARMEKAKIRELIGDTADMIAEEFPELVKGTADEWRQLVKDQVILATETYRMTSFDAIQDYLLLYLQFPVLAKLPLTGALGDILTWKGMPDEDKISEIKKILEK